MLLGIVLHAAITYMDRRMDGLLWPLFHQQICTACHPDVEGLRLGYGWPTIRYDELALRR